MRKLLGLCIVLCPTLLLLGCWANPDGPVATTVGDGSSGATASVRVYDGEGNEIDSPQLLKIVPTAIPSRSSA